MSFISNLFSAGLVDALWSELWKFGAGTGILILLFAGAVFLPTSRQFFIGCGVVVFLAMIVYGYGIKNEKVTCAAQKVIFQKQLHSQYIFTPRQKKSTFGWSF